MPFSYRALDAGVRSIDLKTLVDASRSLGGDWLTTMRRVLLPNMRVAILSATVLTVALVLGEYTMASLDQYQTFPTWIVLFEASNSHVSVAASLMALFLTWSCSSPSRWWAVPQAKLEVLDDRGFPSGRLGR